LPLYKKEPHASDTKIDNAQRTHKTIIANSRFDVRLQLI